MRWLVLFLPALLFGALVLGAQQTHASSPAASRVQAGSLVYQAHCAMCHSVLPGATLVGPSLYGEMKGPAAASVRATVLNGKGKMRGLKGQLTPQDMTNLLAYLRTLS